MIDFIGDSWFIVGLLTALYIIWDTFKLVGKVTLKDLRDGVVFSCFGYLSLIGLIYILYKENEDKVIFYEDKDE